MTRPSLHEAANASFAGLAGAIGASRHEQISEQALSLDQAAAIARAWSLVHGFTMLLLDGRLSDMLRRLPEGHRCRNPAGRHAAARPSAGQPGAVTARHAADGSARSSGLDGQSGEGSRQMRETPDIGAKSF